MRRAERIFLDGEIGDHRIDLQAGRKPDRADRIVRGDLRIAGFRHRCDFFGRGDTTADANRDAQIFGRAGIQQFLELLDIDEALTGGDRDGDLFGDPCHGRDRGRLDRIFVKQRQ
ncbi:hypothetical protein D3C80_693050 [compost metagenome]